MKYLIQEDVRGETYVFKELKNVVTLIEIFLNEGIGVNIKRIRENEDFDTMTQKVNKIVSEENQRRVTQDRF